MRKKFKIQLVLLLSLLFLIGCENLDCISFVKPNLPDKTFAIGELDVEYFDKLTASIKHNSNEDSFTFYFDISGELPPGIEVLEDNCRTLYFEGIPAEKGTFTFYILVKIEKKYSSLSWDDEFGFEYSTIEVCKDTTGKEYTIVIQ